VVGCSFKVARGSFRFVARRAGSVEQESHVRDDVLGNGILTVASLRLGAGSRVQFGALFRRVLETVIIANRVRSGSDRLLNEVLHRRAGVHTALSVDHSAINYKINIGSASKVKR
jgi:hypothetical protein